jgi:hypothetical protein
MLRRVGALVTFGTLATGLGWAARGGTTPQGEALAIAGVWAFVSETNLETGELARDDRTWSGIWVFTGRHHCLARMEKNRRAIPDAELSHLPAEEKVKYYEQLYRYSSTAGTYSVEGSTLRRRWEVSLGPEIIGQESVATFQVEGDRLTVDLPRRSPGSGPAARVVYRRLE